MAKPSPWPLIHAEREALAADLASLTDQQWATPSLCGDWSVREVLAHMTSTAEQTVPKFFAGLIGSGFRFDSLQDKLIAELVEGTPADTLARFKGQISATTHPPGPVDTWLGETIVHSEDIRRPLGIPHTYDPDGVRRAADFFKQSNLLIGSKKRIAGLTLRATHGDWSWGTGPEVSGPMLSLLCAMAGRRAYLTDLSGDGVATLAERMPQP